MNIFWKTEHLFLIMKVLAHFDKIAAYRKKKTDDPREESITEDPKKALISQKPKENTITGDTKGDRITDNPKEKSITEDPKENTEDPQELQDPR